MEIDPSFVPESSSEDYLIDDENIRTLLQHLLRNPKENGINRQMKMSGTVINRKNIEAER